MFQYLAFSSSCPDIVCARPFRFAESLQARAFEILAAFSCSTFFSGLCLAFSDCFFPSLFPSVCFDDYSASAPSLPQHATNLFFSRSAFLAALRVVPRCFVFGSLQAKSRDIVPECISLPLRCLDPIRSIHSPAVPGLHHLSRPLLDLYLLISVAPPDQATALTVLCLLLVPSDHLSFSRLALPPVLFASFSSGSGIRPQAPLVFFCRRRPLPGFCWVVPASCPTVYVFQRGLLARPLFLGSLLDFASAFGACYHPS